MRLSRTWVIGGLLAIMLTLAPGVASAKGFGRGGKRGGSSTPSTSGSRGTVSAGTGRTTYAVGPGLRRYYGPGYSVQYGNGYLYPSEGYYYEPYYAGWGVYPWGYYAYGYHPYWGAPPPPVEARSAPRSGTFSLMFGGASPAQGFAPAVQLQLDSERWGFNLGGIGLLSQVSPDGELAFGMPLFSAHLTYSFVSGPHLRLRAEVGATGVIAPIMAYIGPDFGVSGNLALIGPLGLHAAAHVTPYPARVYDGEAGVSLSFGGLGVRAGWRVLVLDDSHIDENGGRDSFSGPSVSVGFMY